MLKMLRTWDIFDTLIARKCVFPHIVFQIMEQISKINGFANIRGAAADFAVKKDKSCNLDDIYNAMCKISNIPYQIAEKLKQLECDIEIDQAIPITENVNQVKSGDILISDMYLPEEIIRKMLDKIGLFVPVELVITTSGKTQKGGGYGSNLKNRNPICFIQAIIWKPIFGIHESMDLILHIHR